MVRGRAQMRGLEHNFSNIRNLYILKCFKFSFRLLSVSLFLSLFTLSELEKILIVIDGHLSIENLKKNASIAGRSFRSILSKYIHKYLFYRCAFDLLTKFSIYRRPA